MKALLAHESERPIAMLRSVPPPFTRWGRVSGAGGVATPDLRRISPRRLAALSMDLYLAGTLSWSEYEMLAFPPELHPDYERTIGALIGERADPDRPRDYVAYWERRLAFEKKYNGRDAILVERTQRIVDLVRGFIRKAA